MRFVSTLSVFVCLVFLGAITAHVVGQTFLADPEVFQVVFFAFEFFISPALVTDPVPNTCILALVLGSDKKKIKHSALPLWKTDGWNCVCCCCCCCWFLFFPFVVVLITVHLPSVCDLRGIYSSPFCVGLCHTTCWRLWGLPTLRHRLPYLFRISLLWASSSSLFLWLLSPILPFYCALFFFIPFLIFTFLLSLTLSSETLNSEYLCLHFHIELLIFQIL